MADSDFNPFGKHDPFAGVGRIPMLDNLSGSGIPKQRAEFRRPLDDEQSASVGQQALDTGLSGLQYVLGSTDKPGQAVRGVLAGHGASALKHLIPFSDTLGVTGDRDKVSGRDLTDMAGITEKGDKGWGAWGAGLAADIGTDPLSYATLGPKHALTGVGKALQNAGHLKGWNREALLRGFDATESGLLAAGKTAPEIAWEADKGTRIATPAMEALGAKPGQALSGIGRISVPFGPGVTLGTGKIGQSVARGLDATGDFLRYKVPGAKTLGSWFDHTRGNAVDELTQRGSVKYMHPALEAGKQAVREDRYGLLQELDPIIRSEGIDKEALVANAARAEAEGVPHNFDPGITAKVGGAASKVRSINQRYLAEETAAGLPIREWEDPFADYVHRQALDVNHQSLQLGGKGGPKNLYPVRSGSNLKRDELFNGIPGGTNRINDWFRRFATEDPATTAPIIRRELEQDLTRGGNTLTPDLATTFDKKAAALADRMHVARDVYRTNDPAVSFFTPDLAADMKQRGTQHARTMASAKGAIGTLSEAAKPYSGLPDMITMNDAMKRLGLVTRDADLATGKAMEGALPEMYRKLAPKGAGMVDPFLHQETKHLAAEANKFGVSLDDFGKVAKAYEKWSAPEQLKSPLAFLDSWTNAFKGLAYPMWIPAHVRNAATAAANNIRRSGWHMPGDLIEQAGVMSGRGTRDLSGIHPSLAGLSPAEQIEKLRGIQFGAGDLYNHHGLNDEIAGSVMKAIPGQQRFTPFLPGSDLAGKHGNVVADTADLVLNQGLLGSAKATGRAAKDSMLGMLDWSKQANGEWTRPWGKSLNENLGMKGVAGATEDALPAVKAGRIGGTNVENLFRGAQMNREMRNGLSPEMARGEVNKLHFDYDALTDVEKNVMRRAVPFYTFARKNLPLQVETLMTRPGITAAQYKPFFQPTPGDDKGYIPQYLASGATIPLGPEQDGKRQYISKLGLPAEEAFEKWHFKNGLPDIGNSVMDYMSLMNPAIKAPLEQLFNYQFHTQRRLSDLKAPQTASAIGRVFGDDNPQILGQVMANSPLTRFFTSADKLTDPRKAWWQKAANLLTGARITDVETDKTRAIETRSALEGIMREHPALSQFTNFYVKPEDVGKLTPQEILLMRKYTELQDRAKKYAKTKREQIGIPQI